MSFFALSKLPLLGIIAEMIDPVPKTSDSQVTKRKIQGSENPDADQACALLIDGEFYDVGPFLEAHPGGPELLLQHMNGKDVGNLMRGTGDPDAHVHSKSAFKMLKKFKISKSQSKERSETDSNDFEVDLNKPLVFQVGHLKERYQDWVHDPIVCKEIPRFFESDIAERFTRTPWWVIPIVWLPIVVWLESIGIKYGYSATSMILNMALGALIWTLLEYSIHRFMFHMKSSSYWANTLHYLIHGFHHKHPMDGSRLVFPPAFTAVFCIAIWYAFSMFPYPLKATAYGGGLLAYVCYDLTHYFLHFGTPFSDRTRRMKRYHLNHHFKVQTDAFGITTTLWDRIFGTLPAATSLM